MIDRRRGLMGVAKGRLPRGYTEVDHIVSQKANYLSGTVLNTELVIDNENADILLNYKEPTFSENGRTPITNRQSGSGIELYYYAYLYVGTTSDSIGGIDAQSGQKITRYFRFRNNTYSIYKDNDAKIPFVDIYGHTKLNLGYGGTIITSNPACLNAKQNGNYAMKNGTEWYKDNMIIVNGVVKRNFVPCVRDADGTAGMWDLCESISSITNTPFYTGSVMPFLPPEL